MAHDKNKGWLSVPGIRERADRTLAEQTHGLEAAFAEAQGATVLDLGCAEGLIGREFAIRGATRVLGMELLQDHLDVARKACADQPQMEFRQTNLFYHAQTVHPEPYDIVLALSVIHKMPVPETLLRWAAKSARKLLLLRAPKWAHKGTQIRSKLQDGPLCDTVAVMKSEGFVHEKTINNPRNEQLHYWRRSV